MNSTIKRLAGFRLALVNGAAVRPRVNAILVRAFLEDGPRHAGGERFECMGVFGNLIAGKHNIHSAAEPAFPARDFH
jgi:hypothetical protein